MIMSVLKISKKKTRTMSANHVNKNSIQLRGEDIEDVEQFTYLGSVVSRDGGTDQDIKSRIGKATAAFKILRPIWTSQVISVKIKLRIYNTNVKSILLYAGETWRITKALTHKVQTSVNRCLRAILHIKWQDKITNKEIWRRTRQAQAEAQIKRRKWDWLSHTLRKPTSSVVRHALKWNPRGKRKRGRPRSTWRRSVETEGQTLGGGSLWSTYTPQGVQGYKSSRSCQFTAQTIHLYY